MKVGLRRDLGNFWVEVTRICKDMPGYVDVAFSNGRRQLYVKEKDFYKSDFEDKRNSRVKDRTGETMVRGDGTKLTIINYVSSKDIDIYVVDKRGKREVLRNKSLQWFLTGLYEGVPYNVRRLGYIKKKSNEQNISYMGVIENKKDKSKNIKIEDRVGKVYKTSVGEALLVSCSRKGARVVTHDGSVVNLDLEDIEW